MAVAAATVWEVRPTVGNDTNGGGFVAGASGTDYSQQDSKNSGGNNQSTADAVGTGIATITSVTASFTAAIVGNIIYLSGTGVTTGWYQVVTFTNSTTIILDRSPGTFTGATMNIGGALATIATAFNSAQGAVACNTWYIKNTGNLTVTAALQPGFSNNPTPMSFIGYGSSRSDGVKATWTTSTNSVNLINFLSGANNYIFQNLNLTSTAGSPGDGITNNNTIIYDVSLVNCKISGWSHGINGDYSLVEYFDNLILDSCEVSSCTATGVVNSSATLLINSYFHGNTSHGFYFNSTASGRESKLTAIRCVFYNNGGAGVSAPYGSVTFVSLINCDFVSNTGDGFTFVTGFNFPVVVQNCIFASNGGYGMNGTGSPGFSSYSMIQNRSNAFYNNTSGAVSNALLSSPTDVTLSGSPFTAPSSADFSLNGTAGAGTACKGAGYNGGSLFSAQSSVGLDIGAVQSAGSGGGGGGTTTNYIVSKNVTQVLVEDY